MIIIMKPAGKKEGDESLSKFKMVAQGSLSTGMMVVTVLSLHYIYIYLFVFFYFVIFVESLALTSFFLSSFLLSSFLLFFSPSFLLFMLLFFHFHVFAKVPSGMEHCQ